ncbi:MAG: hypothetical protein GF365_01545 [Candidatus Buchananbacteria bacterium]|nr:hypothetical protein [Candidatus Buchananbacteria bacterium]
MIIVKFISKRPKQAVDYNSQSHKTKACKFLFFPKEQIGQKNDLLLVGSFEIFEHKDLLWSAWHRGILGKNPADLPTAIGAGECEKGNIRGWESIGYKIKTPEKYRPIIKNALDMTQ